MKRLLKNKFVFSFLAIVMMGLIGTSTVQAATTPNNGYHVSSIVKISADTVQVNGYFYNVGKSNFYNINNLKLTIKDANGKTLTSTFNDVNLKKVVVKPGKSVNWTFKIKVNNLKAYNFSRWSYGCNYYYISK